jgi:hypothetical protein
MRRRVMESSMSLRRASPDSAARVRVLSSFGEAMVLMNRRLLTEVLSSKEGVCLHDVFTPTQISTILAQALHRKTCRRRDVDHFTQLTQGGPDILSATPSGSPRTCRDVVTFEDLLDRPVLPVLLVPLLIRPRVLFHGYINHPEFANVLQC